MWSTREEAPKGGGASTWKEASRGHVPPPPHKTPHPAASTHRPSARHPRSHRWHPHPPSRAHGLWVGRSSGARGVERESTGAPAPAHAKSDRPTPGHRRRSHRHAPCFLGSKSGALGGRLCGRVGQARVSGDRVCVWPGRRGGVSALSLRRGAENECRPRDGGQVCLLSLSHTLSSNTPPAPPRLRMPPPPHLIL